MTNVLKLVANAATRRLDRLFPGYFQDAKHDHYKDFGFPTDPGFKQFHAMYERNGLARAGVDKTAAKTWQDHPFLQEFQRDGTIGGDQGETELEKSVRLRFEVLRLWQHLAECDRRAMVGDYSALILRFADSKQFREPMERVMGGLDSLVEVIPAWEGQLTVADWDTDERSSSYGQPKMFQFHEVAVDPSKSQTRQFQVHPDRVLIWSKDGTLNGSSVLKPGYNDLMTIEKVVGAGGEGFWKNAKAAPILEIDKDARLEAMAAAMGVPVDEIADRMDEQVADYQRGFDAMLMLQGMKASSITVNLPSPEHFFGVAVQSFAASISCPMKILVGTQTGERASTEDAQEWAQTNMARRRGQVIPNTMGLVQRLVRFGLLPEKDWYLAWTDLTETSMSLKIERALKMAETNLKMKGGGKLVFTQQEIRAVVDLEPLSDAESLIELDPRQRARGNRGGGRAASLPFASNARRRKLRRDRSPKGFDPSQPRGKDGRWVDTGKGRAPSLTAFMRSQRKEPGRHRTLDLGEVQNQAAISAAGGPDTRGFRRLVETSEVNHALKEHGRGSTKWGRGSKLGKADLARIDEIVAASAPLKISRKKGGDIRIEYRAVLEGRTYRYFETVSRRRAALVFKTMWREG